MHIAHFSIKHLIEFYGDFHENLSHTNITFVLSLYLINSRCAWPDQKLATQNIVLV